MAARRLALVDTVALRVKRLREMAGWTRTELAERARVSISYVSRLEDGQYDDPSGIKLAQIAEALGVSADYILIGREPLPREAYPPDLVQLFDDYGRLPEPARTEVRVQVERIVRDAIERDEMRRRIHELEHPEMDSAEKVV